MIPAVLDHIWQSTILAAAIAILVMVFHDARASVRYGLWLTASVKFLVPFASLAALGRLLAPELRPPAQAATDVVFIARAAAPLANARIASHADAHFELALILVSVWAVGFAVVLVSWTTRWAKIRRLLRQATPLAMAAPMPVLVTPTMMEPGLVGLWRPVLLLPEALFEHLDRPGIEALAAHEACHFRRRDNLTAAIHMLVEALFWFHPMVWWIGGRLVEERERACDEAVVGSGHDPAVYAESLLECCRLFLQSPLRCVAGASGSNLSRRVEMIMTAPSRSSLSRSGRAALVAAGVCALASPVAAGWLTSPAERLVVSGAVAIASSPASAHVHRPAAAASAPDQVKAADTTRVVKTDAAPVTPAPPPAAQLPASIELDPVADVTLSEKPVALRAGDVGRLQLAQLRVLQADAGDTASAPAGSADSNKGAAADRTKKICVNQNIAADSRIRQRVCMSQSEWTRLQQNSSARSSAQPAGNSFGDKSSPTYFSPEFVNAASEQAWVTYFNSQASAASGRGR